MEASYTGNDPGDGCIGDRKKQPALRTRDYGQHSMIEELLNMHMRRRFILYSTTITTGCLRTKWVVQLS
jgi:hypothetical protein